MDEQANEKTPNCILPQGDIFIFQGFRQCICFLLSWFCIKASCANGGRLKDASSSYK